MMKCPTCPEEEMTDCGDFCLCEDCDYELDKLCKNCHVEVRPLRKGGAICTQCRQRCSSVQGFLPAKATRTPFVLQQESNGQSKKVSISQNQISINRRGGSENEPTQHKLYLSAAESGDVDAMYQLAKLLYNGDGCEIDSCAVAYWYSQAAAKGLSTALYFYGEGVEENTPEAVS